MEFLYALIIISGAVFALFSVFTQLRLNMHTDLQAKFLAAAEPYNFSPLESMAKRTLKYFLAAAGLLVILFAGTVAVYAIEGVPHDWASAAYVFAVGLVGILA